jgi:hypothetical protein
MFADSARTAIIQQRQFGIFLGDFNMQDVHAMESVLNLRPSISGTSGHDVAD